MLKYLGITAGKGSFAAVYQAGITKIKKELAVNMSIKVMIKGFVSELISEINNSFVSSFKETIFKWD